MALYPCKLLPSRLSWRLKAAEETPKPALCRRLRGPPEAPDAVHSPLNRGAPAISAAGAVAPNPAQDRKRGWLLVPFVSLLASAHLTWFYIYSIPSYLNLERYEAGQDRMPFQGRLLMEYPLRWAHSSAALGTLATFATQMWRKGVLPENFVEAAIYLTSIVVTGLVARELYRMHSRTGLLTPYIYPLVLVMIAGSYCLSVINFFRYYYDLPSLGLFAVGLYLIARRRHPALFAALFVIATVNRETSVFLLFFFLASACLVEGRIQWRRALNWRSGGTATLLALFWLGWHIWTLRHFAGLHFESGPGILINIGCLFLPLLWPQWAGIAAYTLPVLVLFRRELRSSELRAWLWVYPLWFACMMYFGNMIEVRLFGELIPLFACTAALLAEERILHAYRSRAAAAQEELAPGTGADLVCPARAKDEEESSLARLSR